MYSPDPKALPILGDIVNLLPNAKPIANTFGRPPAFLATLPGGQLYLDSILALDTDGWPIGKDKGDPTWQPGTSYSCGGKALNANEVPYFVLPKPAKWATQFGIGIGDFATVIFQRKLAFAVFGDRGPEKSIGEGSMELLRQLGFERLKPNGMVSNKDSDAGVITIVFPGSASPGQNATQLRLLNAIDSIPAALFAASGGRAPGTASPAAPSQPVPPPVKALWKGKFAVSPVARTQGDARQLHIVSLNKPESGGHALASTPAKGAPKILAAGNSLFPLPKSLSPRERRSVADALAQKQLRETPLFSVGHTALLNRFAPELKRAVAREVGARTALLTGDINQAVLASAAACDGKLDTSGVPQTDSGNLACAWAVNEVVRRAVGRPVTNSMAQLNTDDIYDALTGQNRGIALSEAQRRPGSIIISPSAHGVHGHVGILGTGDMIYSNSSRLKKFGHTYTVATWKARYSVKLKLKVLFFDLNPAAF